MEQKMIKILQVLDRASGGACPLGYISLHTNIVDPLKLLEALEEEGYCRKCPVSGWSPTGYPKFEITPKGRSALRELETEMLHTPLSLVAQALTGT